MVGGRETLMSPKTGVDGAKGVIRGCVMIPSDGVATLDQTTFSASSVMRASLLRLADSISSQPLNLTAYSAALLPPKPYL
jgi:hypothetical protein